MNANFIDACPVFLLRGGAETGLRDGWWRVYVELPSIDCGARFELFVGRAVIDDFGTLVVVGSLQH